MASDDLNGGDKTPEKAGRRTVRTQVPKFIRTFDVSAVESGTLDFPMVGAQMMDRFSGYQNPNPDLASMNMNADFHIPELSLSHWDNIRLSPYNPRVDSVSDGATRLNSFENPHIIRGSGDITSNADSKIPPESGVPSNGRSSKHDFKVASGYSSFPNHGNVFSALAQNTSDSTRSDVNLGMALLSNARSDLVRTSNAQSANRERHQTLPGHVTVPTKPLDGRHAAVPDSGLRGVTGQPILPTLTRSTTRAFFPESSKNYTFIDLTGSEDNQDQLGKPFPASRDMRGFEGGLLPNNSGVQQAGNLGQSHAAIHVQPSKDLLGPDSSTGQQHVPAADGRFATVASNVSPSPSPKRVGMQTPPAMTQVQHKRHKTTQPSTNPTLANVAPSFAPLPQISQSLPLVSQALPSLPPAPHVASPLRPQTLLAQGPRLQTQPSTHQPVSRAPPSLPPVPHTASPLRPQTQIGQGLRLQTQPSTHQLGSQTPRVRWRGPSRVQPSPYSYNPSLANVTLPFIPLPQTSPSLPFVARPPPPLPSVTQTAAQLTLQRQTQTAAQLSLQRQLQSATQLSLQRQTQTAAQLSLQRQTQTPAQLSLQHQTQTPHIQHSSTNTIKPPPGPYNTNLASATTSLAPPPHNLSIPSVPQASPSLPPVAQTSSAHPALLQRAQALQRLFQTNPSHPLVQRALQHLANTTQAHPPPARPSPTVPPQSNNVLTVAHIKCQELEAPPLPLGIKCLLCKRDLTFTAEGPVFQPEIPPMAAVLSCGHTFHDHCLEAITPKDQAKNPPCIPCALGET